MEELIDLFIIITGKKVQIRERTSKETFEIYRIKGEDFIERAEEGLAEEFEELKKYILENLYYDNFENCNINIIHQDINKVTLNKIKPFFSTSNELTIYSLEELIALILLKQKNIRPGERKTLGLEKDCFLVEIDKDGTFKIDNGNEGVDISLSINNFLQFCKKLSLFSLKGNCLKDEIKREISDNADWEKLDIYENEIEKFKNENNKLKEEIKYLNNKIEVAAEKIKNEVEKIKNENNKNLTIDKEEKENLKKELIKANETIKHLERDLEANKEKITILEKEKHKKRGFSW